VQHYALGLDLADALSTNADKTGKTQLGEKRLPAQGSEPRSNFSLLPGSRVGDARSRLIESNSKSSLKYAKFTATHRKPSCLCPAIMRFE
jgi:hypothetical protein